jgi:hypothetical protein
MRDVVNAQADKIAAARLAGNAQVEHGKIANGMCILKVDADRPGVFRTAIQSSTRTAVDDMHQVVDKVSIAAEGAGEACQSIAQIRSGRGLGVRGGGFG